MRHLDFPTLIADGPKKSYPIFNGQTPNLTGLDCHYSVLRGAAMPHPPHQHSDEEIIVPILGEVYIIRWASPESTKENIERIGPGRIVYFASGQTHAMRAVGPGSSTYLIFRWSGHPVEADALGSGVFDFRGGLQAGLESREARNEAVLIDSPTQILGRLHCELGIAKPGARAEIRRGTHDTAIILLSGSFEGDGQPVDAPAVAFYPAHQPYGFRATGSAPAQYLELEFDGRSTAVPE